MCYWLSTTHSHVVTPRSSQLRHVIIVVLRRLRLTEFIQVAQQRAAPISDPANYVLSVKSSVINLGFFPQKWRIIYTTIIAWYYSVQ